MLNRFSRTELLLSKEGMEKLNAARIAIFGLGGAGSYAAEAFARSNVGALDLIDSGVLSSKDIAVNAFALHSTIGQDKVEAQRQRIAELNPKCAVTVYKKFLTPETVGEFDFSVYQYIVDTTDSEKTLPLLAEAARKNGVPYIGCFGLDDMTNPSDLAAIDLFSIEEIPSAESLKTQLRKKKIYKLKVISSRQLRAKQSDDTAKTFIYPSAGLILAGKVIEELSEVKPQRKP